MPGPEDMREVYRLSGKVSGLEDKIKTLEEVISDLSKDIKSLQKDVSEARGGLRMGYVIGGAVAAVSGVIAHFWSGSNKP